MTSRTITHTQPPMGRQRSRLHRPESDRKLRIGTGVGLASSGVVGVAVGWKFEGLGWGVGFGGGFGGVGILDFRLDFWGFFFGENLGNCLRIFGLIVLGHDPRVCSPICVVIQQ